MEGQDVLTMVRTLICADAAIYDRGRLPHHVIPWEHGVLYFEGNTTNRTPRLQAA